MNKTTKALYFDKPGPQNTESVIHAVSEKIDETGLIWVIIASSTGETGIRFAKTLKKKANLIAVSWKKMTAENIQKLEALGVALCNYENYLPLHEIGKDDIRNTFYTFGQGMKVCAEVVLIAVDKGFIAPGCIVIAVGGTSSGSDTAAVIKSTSTVDLLGSDIRKRLEIHEIIAMPRNKSW